MIHTTEAEATFCVYSSADDTCMLYSIDKNDVCRHINKGRVKDVAINGQDVEEDQKEEDNSDDVDDVGTDEG